MINAPIYVFDGIGSKFSILNNNFLIGQPLVGYNTLTDEHIGSYIPYLARAEKDWEIGVGYVQKHKDSIIVERTNVVRSSNDNKLVTFNRNNSNSSEFYIFANEFGFNSGFNNVIVKTSDFHVEPIQAVYLIDTVGSSIQATLPKPENSENLVVQFKLIGASHSFYIRNSDDVIIDSFSVRDTYGTFVCDGKSWYRLNPKSSVDVSALSLSEEFSALSDPVGDNLSFQYNDAGSFTGALFYYGANSNLLLGTDSQSTAHTIIPVTGSESTVFNADNQNANFIVEGSGSRNFFFDYRGRIGLNIPSGSSPSTILHIINTTCREGIRLENRTSCHPANVTLYYKPSSDLSSNETVGLINLAAKDTDGNQTNFVQLESIAVDNTANSSKGRFNLTVATTDAAGTGIQTIQTDPDLTFIGYEGNNSLAINNSGSTQIGYSNTNIEITSNNVGVTGSNLVKLTAPSISLNGSVDLGTNSLTTNGSITANSVQSNYFKIQNIAEGSILSVNSSGNVIGGSNVKLPNVGSGYVLTTTEGGSITGVYQLDDYFLTNGDILWNKYSSRPCSVALRQITFTDNDVPVTEFALGDQVEININGTLYYRDIVELEVNNEVIVSVLVNQNITSSTIESATISSITKGGYLSIGRTIEEGTETDGTFNTISVRPGTDTVFNSNHKDVNFSVYGIGEEPALKVQANAGLAQVPSGIYHNFATFKTTCNPCDVYVPAPDIEIFEIVVNSGGIGLSNSHSSANFDYAASGIFSGMVTDVGTNGLPSFYGTYDQNGNAAEWVWNDDLRVSTVQYVAGGSWKTEYHSVIGSSGLKSVMQMDKTEGYEEVGFRVAGLYNLTDSSNILDEDKLNLKFVGVGNPKNLSDEEGVYLFDYDETNNPNTDDQYSIINFPNLGSVRKTYRIGKYEVTNNQYAQFLNAVATVDDRSLYKTEMGTSDVGGIIKSGTSGSYSYAVKDNMGNKPVVFVDYISAIRFTNWLHNGAQLTVIDEDDVDSYIDYGGYMVSLGGNSTYSVEKNIYQKYWLPSINEWHKAAYYEPVNGAKNSGSSSVMVKREDPYIVATGYDPDGQVCTTLANLSVSGWLYVDHIIVGDGTIRSAKKFANCSPTNTQAGTDTDTDTGTDTGADTGGAPTTDEVFDNDNTNTGGGTTTCIGDDCPPVDIPSVPGGGIGDTGSSTDDACSGDDPPPYCSDNYTGPGWYPD